MSLDVPDTRGRLLRWYERHRRALPWRRTRDPYRIWVAEVMLQQTQVATVLPYYRRFLRRLPDLQSLARASEEEVLALWSGLGYYRRARLLRQAAQALVEAHGGRLPRDPELLAALPGVGRYTAGAIASMAFGVPVPAVDGNVRRVLARLCGQRRPREASLWALAARLVAGPRPGELNQALMELGATVCTPRSPSCNACPVRGACRARARGAPERYPRKLRRPRPQSLRVAVAWIERDGRVLLERTGTGSPLRGMWDLPAVALTDTDPAQQTLAAVLARRCGLRVRPLALLTHVAHTVTARRMRLEVYLCALEAPRPSSAGSLRWVRAEALDDHAVSGATRKILRRAPAPARYARSQGGIQPAAARSRSSAGPGGRARP